MFQCDIKRTVESLLKAPYPFKHERHKTIYEKCGLMFFSQKKLYQCNFCKIKMHGDTELLEHNKSFGHQTEMEKHIAEMLKTSTIEKYDTKSKCIFSLSICFVFSSISLYFFLFFFVCYSNSGRKVTSIKLSGMVKDQLVNATLQAAQTKLNEAMVELKNEYEWYRMNPTLHPLYAKEWNIFYLRRLSDILASKYFSLILLQYIMPDTFTFFYSSAIELVH